MKYYIKSSSRAFAKIALICPFTPNGKPYKYYAFDSVKISDLTRDEILGTFMKEDLGNALEIIDFI